MVEENTDAATQPAGGVRPAASSEKMRHRKRVSASNATATILLTIGAVTALNIISTRIFGSLDLTENKVYTLSQASKDVVAALPDYVTIKAYISEDLPPELKWKSRYVRDLLDEYRGCSKGKLRFMAFDPAKDKKIEDEAGQCNVQRLQIQVRRDQKFEIGSYFLGLCFQYRGKDQAIPETSQIESLEYQISSLIKRMTQRKHKVAFTNGHGESDLTHGFTMLKHRLEQEFDTSSVNPSLAAIGDDVDALVVGGPKQAFDDKGRRQIDAFLMKGKSAIIMLDGMVMSAPRPGMPDDKAQSKVGQVNEAGLNELIEKYGFKVGQDFVLDRLNVPGPVDVGGQRRVANQPMFVGVTTKGDYKDNSIMAGVGGMVFPYASSIELVGPLAGGKPAAGKLWTLAASSPASWKQSGFFLFTPTTKIEEGKEKASYGLAYAYHGPLKSAYPPADTTPGMSALEVSGQTPGESKKPVRLMVIGDSDFASDDYVRLSRFLPIYEGGGRVLLNAIAWIADDEALTLVRTKTPAARPIQLVSPGAAMALEAINVGGVPLAFIGFGIIRWRLRLARRTGQKL